MYVSSLGQATYRRPEGKTGDIYKRPERKTEDLQTTFCLILQEVTRPSHQRDVNFLFEDDARGRNTKLDVP